MTDQPDITDQLKVVDRYTALQAAAGEVNHQVRVMVIPGPPIEPGQTLTVKPIEADAMTLEGALDWAETYVKSEEARRRGELYRARADAKAASTAAYEAWRAAREAARKADDAVEADVTDAIFPPEEPPLQLSAAKIRATLDPTDPQAQATLERIKDLPDETMVTLEVDDEPAPE